MRSSSDSDLGTSSRASSGYESRKPLKTCWKHKAKSANTTLPDETTTVARSSSEIQKLRRVKTVDFEKDISPSSNSRKKVPSGNTEHQKTNSRRASMRGDLCPGTALIARRTLACPAVTRTDVHVVTIGSSSSKAAGMDRTDQCEIEAADPATPTMPIVEWGNEDYEVFRDDGPPEHNVRTTRHESLVDQAQGLDCVNTKLTEWSGDWNTPACSFKPTVVAFPGNDRRRARFERDIVDDENIDIFAPPNSERVSAAHSRHISRRPSARMSRATSNDNFSEPTLPRDTFLDNPSTRAGQTLVVPNPEAWSALLMKARRKRGVSSPERKLSNVEETDLKFRNHRDSVALAHSRLVQAGVVRPELFAHEDPGKMAKRRMHVKTLQHAHRKESKSDSNRQSGNEAVAMPPLPVVKAHAAAALQHGAPRPILRQSKSASGRHIRIEEHL